MKTVRKTAIVSGADSNYYPLLKEWLCSLRRFKESEEIDICILDAGLSEEQREELSPLVTQIVNPVWPSSAIQRKAEDKEYLKACICRPFLPKMFPGYQTYMWMDCDTWIQDWNAVVFFLQEAEKNPQTLIITNGADRSGNRSVRIKWFWRFPYSVRNFYFSNAKSVFGFRDAKKLLSRYVLYAGCFAMQADAPHWKRWQELATMVGEKGKVFTAEQLSLGYLVYLERYEVALLPAYVHWILGNKPLWDEGRGLFVEPHPPYNTLGILHLSGVDDMRSSRKATTLYKTTGGGQISLNCRYPHLDGQADVNGAPERA